MISCKHEIFLIFRNNLSWFWGFSLVPVWVVVHLGLGGCPLEKDLYFFSNWKYVLLVVVIEKHLALAFVQILSLLLCKIVANWNRVLVCGLVFFLKFNLKNILTFVLGFRLHIIGNLGTCENKRFAMDFRQIHISFVFVQPFFTTLMTTITTYSWKWENNFSQKDTNNSLLSQFMHEHYNSNSLKILWFFYPNSNP
jgi:hypothetical protein